MSAKPKVLILVSPWSVSAPTGQNPPALRWSAGIFKCCPIAQRCRISLRKRLQHSKGLLLTISAWLFQWLEFIPINVEKREIMQCRSEEVCVILIGAQNR